YLARPQQTGLVDHSTGGLHDQSEGEKRLKAIPLLLTTNFPLLKTTRQYLHLVATKRRKCGIICGRQFKTLRSTHRFGSGETWKILL
ncbi:MAG: hypothetical protein IJ173_02820, partial [Kiritimatiellae bacterium]|nr:hypothetical protein [Kiritimatiellia bacterium]